MTSASAFHFESLVWDWPIAIYLFLIGISAGLVTLAILLRRFPPEAGGSDSTLLRTTLVLGPGAIILGLLILVFHLTRPWTFWKLMFHYSFTSVMSMGVMLFQLYMVVLVLWLAKIFEKEVIALQQRFVPRLTIVSKLLTLITPFHRALETLMLVLAADHVIQQEEAFRDAVRAAIPYAESGKLVTFGIVPDLPETGYGYIRRGNVTPGEGDSVAFDVAQFVEKPNLETAQAYVASGEYYWNSGMFLFRAGRYLEELRKYRPDILSACEKAMAVVDPDLDFIRVDEEAFLACPEESIDYAVMERTADAVVVPMDAGWSDVGSWSSLWEISAHTPEGNVHHGDVISHKTENSYVYAESGLVTTVGVKDLVVVQTKDAVLIADRNAVQDVKKVVEKIKADGRHEHHIHREVYRPWGKYDSIDAGDRYHVKRITVKPGEGLSVQMHHHRAEHWVVVAGTAKVTIDGEVKLLGENESIYIPLGATHCLENPGKIPLDLIEVRSGSYLEEDDIVRFQDRYGRV